MYLKLPTQIQDGLISDMFGWGGRGWGGGGEQEINPLALLRALRNLVRVQSGMIIIVVLFQI